MDTTADGLRIEAVTDPAPEHAAALARLLPQLSSSAPPDLEHLRAIVGTGSVRILVARLDEAIVGTLTLIWVPTLTGTRALIEDVVVDEAARGRGLGEALVRHALDLARSLGARTVDLTSRPSRASANRLYLRAGFLRRETNVYRVDLEP